MNNEIPDKVSREIRLGMVFTPSAPVNRLTLLAGRTSQRRALLDAVLQRGRHAVLFGERGVGKTSLASVLHELLESAGQSVLSLRVNCEDGDDYSLIWLKAFDNLQIIEQRRTLGFNSDIESATRAASSLFGADQSIAPRDVRLLLDRLGEERMLVVIIDEFDRVAGKVGGQFADTIKTLSDQSVPATLVLVGVADSVSALISEHESIERALAQVRMPRMSFDELQQIIDGGLAEVDMTIDDIARTRIASLSQGLPHYTHLITLYAARHANDHDSTVVRGDDVEAGIVIAVENAQETITSAHHRAVMSSRADSLFRQVALACALARTDERGYFPARAVRPPMQLIMGRPYAIPAFARHMNAFCGEARGSILEKIGARRNYRFRFNNPLLPPFIIMSGIAQGMIKTEDLARIQSVGNDDM